ncbi:MAG TPA: HupE/UreJ family protein [Vicinamibacterales bacterium]|nr:HupE/UreJ family protein [Vicinamibacterales bacterium]
MKIPSRCVLTVLIALTLHAVAVAHDIPDEIAIQSYVRPQQDQLQVLLRIPLLAIADANLPKDGTGYLAMPYIDAALREAANQISNGVVFLEGDERLTRYEMTNARISLPSDRSYDTYEGALARVRGARLPDTTQVYYNQGFLDLELHHPIQSAQSPFSMRVLFGRGLANRTATYINFIRADGAVRAFRIHDETPLVRLDPKAHQAGWVFLKAGFYRFLNGLDHLLFVVVLALPFRRIRDLVKPFAAFALAHSVTLTVTAFGLAVDTWFVPTVGALIGLSLVYVAIENAMGTPGSPLRTGILRHRWLVALVFGLFHGLGFAIALQDTLQFAGSHAIVALVSYNVGLELGTLIILAIAVPAANALFANTALERAGIVVSSVLIGHAGWHWMTERVAIARLSSWPVVDLNLMLIVVRWLLAIAVVGGIMWFVTGLLKKKPEEPQIPEKSIVDSR